MRVVKRVFNGIKTVEAYLQEGEEALIVSDTHFGLKVRGVYVTSYKELVDMLRQVSGTRRIKLVVLLGDIFELWVGGLQGILSTAYDFLRTLASLDATIIYVSGNHDRIISNIYLESAKNLEDVYVVPEFAILNVSGKRILLIHGHQFDSLFVATKGLWKIQSYIYTLSEALIALPGPFEWILAFIAAAVVFAIFSLMPFSTLPETLAIYLAAFFLFLPLIILVWRTIQDKLWYLLIVPMASTIFRGRSRGKSVEFMVRKPVFGKTVRLLDEIIGGLDAIVFGHTHVPGIIEWNDVTVVNTGAWVKNNEGAKTNTYVVISRDAIELFSWLGKEAPIDRHVIAAK